MRKFEGATTGTCVRTPDPPECFAVWPCRLPSFVRLSSVVLHLAKEFFFCFPVLPRPLYRHIAQSQHCKDFSRLCFTFFRRLVVFIAIHAALFRCSLLMLCLFALLPLSLLSLLRLRCPECQDPVVPEALQLRTWLLSQRGSRVVRSLAL